MFVVGHSGDSEQTTVEAVRLDDLIKDTIDFVKIDVEGHELEVLKGMKNLLSQYSVGSIQFEYGGTFIDARVFLKDIWELFRDLRYEFYKVFPNNLMKIERYNQSLETFQYQNWLVLRKDIVKPGLIGIPS